MRPGPRSVRRAFVLGAGLGTRLRPLTDDLPKPLVPIFQKPLITFAFDHLAAAGVESFVVNTHHLPGEFENCFPAGYYNGRPITFVHEPERLETGGGIRNAKRWLEGEPFIVYSGDILTGVNLAPLMDEHFRSGNDVTLALRETGLAANVAFRDGRVIDIGARYGHTGTCDYANVSIWNAAAFARIPAGRKISFVPVLVEWIRDGGRIGGVMLSDGHWFNIGSRAEYLAIHRLISAGEWRPGYVKEPGWPAAIAPGAMVDPAAQISGFSSVGAGCRIGARARVEDSILWPGAQVAADAQLRNCIVRCGRSAAGVISNADV